MTDIKDLKEIAKDLSVLYVEDDVNIRKSMEAYLKKLFNLVRSAENGKEGLELFATREFDIVVTDLSMPVMDGIEMIEEIKKQNETQAILITTAHTESNYMLSAIKDGVDGYIIKPFDFPQLNYELFKAVQKIKMHQENEAYKLHLSDMVEDKTHELENLIDYQNNNYEKTLASMVAMIEQRDTYTAGHSKRVAKYSQMIAKEMGYSEEDCTLIHQAGILHDVGKVGTPDAVLLNPKALNDLEYKLIQGHVSVSYKLLSSIPMFTSLAEIVYSHHERYDGRGYPRGLKADEITPLARIMIVADSFDAMTTNRIYKSRKTVDQAIEEIIRLSEEQFDPKVVKSAVKALTNVKIDENVNQLPQTKLEEERFAYFYKDTITEAYNQNYLEVVLMKNSHERFFNFMYIISIKNFSAYNKDNSWDNGNIVLESLASLLLESVEHAYIFRVFGDDFVILSERIQDMDKLKIIFEKLFQQHGLKYEIDTVDLEKKNIEKVSQIESIQATQNEGTYSS